MCNTKIGYGRSKCPTWITSCEVWDTVYRVFFGFFTNYIELHWGDEGVYWARICSRWVGKLQNVRLCPSIAIRGM